jgi:hypothetical protein
MPKGFLPNPDAALLGWSLNFKMLINSTPAEYGIAPARAAAYAVLHDTYAAALAASDPPIRSRSSTANKNDARAALRTEASFLSRIVKGTATVTAAQKVALGLNVRARHTPVPPPTAAPGLKVLSVRGWTVHIALYNPANSRRKPTGVDGATIFTYVGATPPTDLAQWSYEGHTGQSRLDVAFPNTLPPGTTVWFAAFWFNPRMQSGPACAPVSAELRGDGVAMAA